MDNIPSLRGYPVDPTVVARRRADRRAKQAARAAGSQYRRGITRLWKSIVDSD